MKNISVGTHKLKLDFANGASGVLFSTQADSGRTFEVQVLDEENNVQDITGLTLDFFVGTSEEVTKVSATIKDAVNGIFEINAVSSQFKYAGVHKAQFVLRDATGAKIGTQIYNIHVEESIENGATVGENVIVSFEAVSEAAELLRNSGAVLEESKEVSATLKTDITKAETIDTTLKATTKTAEDTNTKAQATNTTLTKTIETANTANTNTTNTLKQLTAENDEATLNITALDEKNKLATTNITDLTNSTDIANTSNTNLKTTITNAGTAEQKLKTEIGNAGLENYITLEDIKNKADLGADGKVVAEQMPKIGGRNLIRNSNDFTKLYGYGTTTLNITKDIIVPEWNAADATRVTSSGGTEDIKISSGTYPTEAVRHEPYVFSTYIKNVSDKPLTVRYNAFNPYTWTETVNPGESKRIVFKGNWRDMDDLKVSYFMFLSPAASDNVDFVIWRMKQEKGTVATDWSPAPEDFALAAHTHPTLPTQQQITSWNSKQDKLVAGANITISGNTISATDRDTVTTINGKTGAIAKADITALGIPAQDTTYNVATTTLNGLMSATDKTKLDNVKEDVILTQSAYDSLSDVQKNDVTKKYWISED